MARRSPSHVVARRRGVSTPDTIVVLAGQPQHARTGTFVEDLAIGASSTDSVYALALVRGVLCAIDGTSDD